jgi:hypothetical protein
VSVLSGGLICATGNIGGMSFRMALSVLITPRDRIPVGPEKKAIEQNDDVGHQVNSCLIGAEAARGTLLR